MAKDREQDEAPEAPQPNFILTGDEARFLMLCLQNAPVQAPASAITQLYLRLSDISLVQPPR